MSSLTQAEAERRAALISVQGYDLSVDLTHLPTGPEVRCVSTVTFTCHDPGAETFVDCAAEVVGATLNGVPLPPPTGDRIALPGLADRNVLRVESVQANTIQGEGVHKAVDPADGEVYFWTSFEPDEAHHVWACFDQPDLKAPHAFTVTAPAAWTVTSNSGGARIEETGPDARRWSFPATPPLSTYNVVVNAGPLVEIRRDVGGYDLGLYARRSLAPILERDADEIFTVTGQGLGFYAGVLGIPFPQRKYDQVFMPEFGGAMENYGCVTWTDTFLRRSAPTPSERETFAKVLLHEMAHMWFGNIVTMRWWDDLWLNEAFAEFACHWAAERATAYSDAWAGHLAGDQLRAYLADQGPTSHPICQPVHDVDQAASIFDDITYPKGASVLRQLMTYVGEPNFVAGMTAYFAQHAWGNTTLQDLIDALAQASGRSLDAWRTGWLETAGTDRLTLDQSDGKPVLAARGPGGGEPRPQVVAVGAYRREGAGLRRIEVTNVEVAGPRTSVDLTPGADLYLVNDEDLTFATTRSGPAVFGSAPALPTAIGRGVAVAEVWDMLVTGETGAVQAVDCLTAVLATETADSVIEPYLTLATDVAELWAAGAERVDLTARVHAASQALAERPALRRVALRALARTAGDLDEIARLEHTVGDDVDLWWRVLVRKAELGGETAADVERLLSLDPDPDAKFRALSVRAATPDPAEKAAMWGRMADRTIPIGSFRPVAAAFWRPGQDELLAPYPERYLELLPDMQRGGMIPAMYYTRQLFPLFSVDAEFLPRAEVRAQSAAPVVRKTLLERSDLIRRMLRSRG